LELPDWISSHVFKIAGVQLDPDDKRQAAILRILRVQSAEGIEISKLSMLSKTQIAAKPRQRVKKTLSPPK